MFKNIIGSVIIHSDMCRQVPHSATNAIRWRTIYLPHTMAELGLAIFTRQLLVENILLKSLTRATFTDSRLSLYRRTRPE